MCFSSVGGSLWHISWLAYLCSSPSLVYHMVGQPIDKLIKIFIIDQILFSLFFIIPLTLQVNFAGSCPATSCGHSASQSTRYSLGLLGCVGRSSCSLLLLLDCNINAINIANFNYGLEKRMIWNTKVFKVHFVGLNGLNKVQNHEHIYSHFQSLSDGRQTY